MRMIELTEAVILIAKELLLPEVRAVAKPVCLMRVANIEDPFRTVVECSIGHTALDHVREIFRLARYKFYVTSDNAFFIIVEEDFFNQLFDHAMDNNQEFPHSLGDYLYNKFVEYKGQPG